MFLFLSFNYFQLISSGEKWKETFVIGAMILFAISHIAQFRTNRIPIRIIWLSFDFILSTCFGALFPKESGLLYLIFFGVVATTVFLVFENKKILKSFSLVFLITWILVSYEKYLVTGEFSFPDNILSFMFVVYGSIVGSLIRNLTSARETIATQYEQLNESHEALQDVHQQLSDYSKQVEELTTIRERNQIAREIHDTVGHKMTALLVQLQLAREYMQIDSEKTNEILKTCEHLTRNSLEEIRMSVRTLREDDNQHVSFLQSLRVMMNDFSKMTELETTLDIEGDPSVISPTLQPTIIRIIQESLTNAKRHGLATKCQITIFIKQDLIHIEIHDNGIGTTKVVHGFGLVNMKERVQEHGGNIQFKSNETDGFTVMVDFPLKRLHWTTEVAK